MTDFTGFSQPTKLKNALEICICKLSSASSNVAVLVSGVSSITPFEEKFNYNFRSEVFST